MDIESIDKEEGDTKQGARVLRTGSEQQDESIAEPTLDPLELDPPKEPPDMRRAEAPPIRGMM
jgi:hypothetical protein